MTAIQSLLARIENLDGLDRSLDVDIFTYFKDDIVSIRQRPGEKIGELLIDYGNGNELPDTCRFYCSDIIDALTFVGGWLPNWWWTAGRCDLTGHASIGPDYNSKKDGVRELLLAKFPIDQFHKGFDADLAPGGSDFRVACALMHCALQALELIEEMKGDIHYAYTQTA